MRRRDSHIVEGRGFAQRLLLGDSEPRRGVFSNETLWEVLHVTLKKYEKLGIVRVSRMILPETTLAIRAKVSKWLTQ